MHKKWLDRLFLGFFFGFVGLPVIVFYSFNSAIQQENTENKTLSEFPRFSLSSYSTWPKTFEEWFSDRLPFKTQFIHAYRNFEYKAFGRFEQSDVIVGEGDWLFYGKTIENYKGLDHFSQQELKQALDNTANFFEPLESNHIQSLLYIAPDKEQVYVEKVPAWYKRESSISLADQLTEHFQRNSQIRVIYPKEEFRLFKQEQPLYFSTDTHWNELGGYVAAQQVWQAFHAESIPSAFPDYTVEVSPGKDLSNMVGLKHELLERNTVTIEYPDKVSAEKIGTQDYGAIQRFQSDAPHHEKMIVIGDSFAEYFLRSAIHDFDDIIFVTFGRLSEIDLLAEKPRYVVVMLVERNLPFLLNGFY